MNFDQMISLIVEEVLKRLKSPPKKALVIFTGGSIGFNDSIQQVKRLLDNGWNLTVALSRSAEIVLTHELIKDSLGIDEIYLESNAGNASNLYNGVDLLILPTLTMNTAVKIALGISDTLTTNIVSNAIMRGMKIVAVKDACDLENPIRLGLGYNKAPISYIKRMREYIQIMQEYGITLVNSHELFDSIMGKESTGQRDYDSSYIKPQLSLDKRVITREDIIEASQNCQRLIIGKNSVITALANEAAGEIGVKIIRNP